MDSTLAPEKIRRKWEGFDIAPVWMRGGISWFLIAGILFCAIDAKKAEAQEPPNPIGTSSQSTAPPETIEQIRKNIRKISEKDLTFRASSDQLNARNRSILRHVAETMKRYPKVNLLLIGHTDERGTSPFNLRLGVMRGQSAKNYLLSLGVPEERIHVVSFGKRAIPGRLLCAEHRERCWRTHRLVHLVGYFPNEILSFQSPPAPSPQPTRVLPQKVVVFQGKKKDEGIYLLLPPGKVEVENVLMYLHNSSTQVAAQNFSLFPILGNGVGTNIQRVNDDYYIEMVSVFVGITHKLELEGDVPYVYRTQSEVSAPLTNGVPGQSSLTNQTGNNLGDIAYGLHYQFNTEPVLGGIYMANVMVKSITGTNPFTIPVSSETGLLNYLPTGTGFWSVEPGISIYVPITPIVFYANLNYIYNFSRNFGGAIGNMNPGNATDISFGGWFSFNQKSLFTIGYDQMTIWPPTENGVQIPLTRIIQMGSVLFGGSYYVTPRFFYMINVAAGVTPDAPNVAVTIRFPLFN